MSEKTEPPTPKRIRDARKMGQYLVSREIVSLSLLVMIASLLFVGHKELLGFAIHAVTNTLAFSTKPLDEALPVLLPPLFVFIAAGCALAYIGNVLAGIISNIVQTGLVFNGSRLKKGLQSLNAIKNAKQIFAKKNLFTFGMNIIKVLIIGVTVVFVIRDSLPKLVTALSCGLECSLHAGSVALAGLIAAVCAAFFPIAVIDYLMQRYFYLKELKMSKDEVKREYKEMEGDPEIKAQRKQIHQEVLNTSMLNQVKKATVIIKNPTHYAVALLYKEDETPLPLVIGKGEGALAQAILKIAEREEIPVYENVELAQALYHDLEMNSFITGEFIEPVVEALRYVEEITGGHR